MDGKLDDDIRDFCLNHIEDDGLSAEAKEEVMDTLMSTIFAKLRLIRLIREVRRFLANRLAEQDKTSLPVVAKEVNLLQMLRQLYVSDPTEHARRLHKISAEVQFRDAIDGKVHEERKNQSDNGSTERARGRVLASLVREEAGNVDAREFRTRLGKARREYNAGQIWAQLMRAFEGPGIMFLFVLAGKLRNFVKLPHPAADIATQISPRRTLLGISIIIKGVAFATLPSPCNSSNAWSKYSVTTATCGFARRVVWLRRFSRSSSPLTQ